MGIRSKTSFLKSSTRHPENVKYAEYIGDQTINYSITFNMQKLFSQSALFVKPFLWYHLSHDLKGFGHF